MKVIILSGAPGSGKSKLAKEIHKEQQFVSSSVIVSADDFMMEDGEYKFDVSKLSHCHEACYAKFVESLVYEVDTVIVDNTNTEAWEMTPYVALAKFSKYEVEIREFHGGYKNIHGVGEHQVQLMREKIKNRNLPFHLKALVVK